ncbi:MAG: hypothetical protein FJ299_07440, partial [Planctomycetes bacterium]|nr:hypothetical protein [Planctomycetota bacterium]
MPDASPADERGDARVPRATHYWMFVVVLLATAAWCWRGLLEVSFTGEDLLLIRQQADGYERTGTVFRPLWHAWFWLGERVLGSADPRPWHAAQLGLHLLNAALVAAVARALRLAVLPALAATALFALGAGCADSLCWIAASNRQLSALGALVCVLGLVRYDQGPRWGWIALAGFAVQFGSNEEVYGTALLATGCLLWLAWKPARRRDPRAWLVCLLPAAALALHFLFLRGSGGSSVLSGGNLAALVFEQAPRNALARLAEIAAGWLASADELDALALAVLGCSLSWMQRERQRACVVAGYLLCSFVPFALEGGSRYRDYPTLAPLALALGLLVDSLLLYVPASPAFARRALGALA